MENISYAIGIQCVHNSYVWRSCLVLRHEVYIAEISKICIAISIRFQLHCYPYIKYYSIVAVKYGWYTGE